MSLSNISCWSSEHPTGVLQNQSPFCEWQPSTYWEFHAPITIMFTWNNSCDSHTHSLRAHRWGHRGPEKSRLCTGSHNWRALMRVTGVPALIYQAILPYPPHSLHAPCCRVDLSSWASLMAQQVKNPLQCRRCRRYWFGPWVGNIPWRRKWWPTPILLPEKTHGQRSLAGYSSQGHEG